MLVLVIAVAGAGAAAVALRQGDDQRNERERTYAQRAAGLVEGQIQQAQGALLGVRGLAAASPQLDQTRFQRFARPFLGRLGLGALFWTDVVPGTERAAFEGSSGLRITGVAEKPKPHLVPARTASVYYPLRFMAPFPAQVRPIMGLDLAVIPGAASTFAAAARTGRSLAGPAIAPVSPRPGLFLVAPVYRAGAPTKTAAQRAAALLGVAGAYYRVNELARAALGRLTSDISIQILDPGGRSLFGPEGTLTGATAAIEFGGRTWQLVLSLNRSPSIALPATILGAGLLLALLVALLFRQANRRERESARAQRELRRQASITEAVLDATPDGIRVVDLEGATLLANPALDRLLGAAGWGSDVERVYEEADRFAARTTDPGRFQGSLAALYGDRLLVTDEEYELAESGRIFHRYSAPVRAGADPAEVTGRIFVHREVTAERRAERAKDEFIALASHELRTPLTSIVGYLEILDEEDVGPLVSEQRRVVSVIERNAKRLMRLVDDLLVVARSDVGRLGIVLEDLNLVELTRECVQGARPASEERKLVLGARVDADSLPVRADRARLAQVIDNLVANALKFTPPGGEVQVAVSARGEDAVVEVSDTGIGIPRAEQTRLFERFYRTSQAIAAAAPGSGLGLAISKMIVEAHGGRIEVDSEEGAGATFRVFVPLASPAAAAPPAAFQAAPSA